MYNIFYFYFIFLIFIFAFSHVRQAKMPDHSLSRRLNIIITPSCRHHIASSTITLGYLASASGYLLL